MGSSPTARTSAFLSRKPKIVNQFPQIPIRHRKLVDHLFDFFHRTLVNRILAAQFDVCLPVRNAHQDGLRIAAVGIEGIDAMVVSVPNSRKLAETLCVLEDWVTDVWRAAFHLGQPLDQINSGASRVQRQKDDDRDILVGAGQPSDQVNQQAFRVGPHVV